MLFEYIIQVYYLILTFFFPSYKTMTMFSMLSAAYTYKGMRKLTFFIVKGRESSIDYLLFSRYFPSNNTEAKF